MTMDDSNKAFKMVEEKRVIVPNPPPMPCLTTTLHERKMLAKAMDVLKNRTCSSIKCDNSYYVNNGTGELWERLFDRGYRADVVVVTDYGGHVYAHASVLGMVSPVIRQMLKKSKTRNGRRSIRINGVPHDAVRVFIRFFYSSSYEPEEMKEYVLHLLVLSHVFVVPHLKEVCQALLENCGWLNVENVVDVFQLALLCDTPRLTFICHRMILNNFQGVTSTEGWRVMKEGHPALEKEILETVVDAETREHDRIRKKNEKNMYVQLYEAMEALVHICRDGCKTIGPHDKAPKEDEATCEYRACKGLELLVRHFAACKLRVPGGCPHCKRMWQLLELHSRLCADSDLCGVPLCRNFKEKSVKQNKKEEMRWKILAKKIIRSKIIYGRSPFFSLAAF